MCSEAQSCLTLCDTWTVAHQAPLIMGFPRQEQRSGGGRWEGGSCLGTHVRIKDFKIKKKKEQRSGLPFPSPGDFPEPGIEPVSLTPSELADGFFTTSAP